MNAAPASGARHTGNPAGSGGNSTFRAGPAHDAYAPAGGTVAKPGNTPMVPTPR